MNEIERIRLLTSDFYGDLTPAAEAAVVELRSVEARLEEKAFQRRKAQKERLEQIERERKARVLTNRFRAAAALHKEQMAACANATQHDLPTPAGVNCSAEPPTKPTTLIKLETLLQNATTPATVDITPHGAAPELNASLVTSSGSVNGTQTTPANDTSSTTDTQGVIEPDFSAALARSQAAKTALKRRIERIEFFESFLQDHATLGSGEVLRALNVRAADIYNSIVEQFTDTERRDSVLLEMSALYPIADELAQAASEAAAAADLAKGA